MKTLTALAALFTLTATAAADNALPKEVTNMHCLIGTWKATGTMSAGADKTKIAATWTCKPSSAKFGVLCTLRVNGVPGVGVYEETDLFGYDPGAGKYHWFSVTNAGETHDHVAAMPTTNTIQFVYTGAQEGKPFKEVIDMVMSEDGKSLALRSETFLAGASTSVFDVKAKK